MDRSRVNPLWHRLATRVAGPSEQNPEAKPSNLQTKLQISQPQDMYEQEADRVADTVMRKPESTVMGQPEDEESIQTKPLGQQITPLVQRQLEDPETEKETEVLQTKEVPGRASEETPELESRLNALKGGGRPLPDSTRAFLEPRFGHGFGHVRVHTDSQAAGSVHARAFTIGQDVVFGAGQYAPGTQEGKRLLAHELTHVVQQSPQSGSKSTGRQPIGSGVLIQRQKKAKTAPLFYQGVLDAIASEKGIVIPSGRLPFLRKLESLCKAVAAQNTKTVALQVKNLVQEAPPHLPPHLLVYLDLDDLANELISRTFLMGFDQPSKDLRAYLRPLGEKERSPLLGKYDIDLDLWEKMVTATVGGAKPGSKAEALSKLDRLLRVFKWIHGEAAGLDEKELKRDRERVRVLAEVSISVYYSKLIDLFVQFQVPIQKCFQVLMDAAIDDLESGRGLAALNEAKAVLEGKIKPVIDLKVKWTYVGSRTVPITRSKFGKGGGKYLDYFLEGRQARARRIKFTYYDKEQQDGEEKELSLERIYVIRKHQIKFLAQLYGGGGAALIAQQKRLRLHSNDDWRRFLLAKFKAQRARGKSQAQALSGIIDLLKRYLAAFTTHVPYNVDDFSDNYLTKSFPRALTGQLIHDCGVYALRIAYMLSLVRRELGLRFRFIRLPAHLGLVITGKNLPVFIVHNNEISKIPVKALAQLKQEWQGRDETGKELKTARPLDETRLLGELAAAYFIPGVDMPFRFEEMPAFKTRNLKKLKRLYWRFYRRKTIRDVLAKDPEQFHMRYLELLENYKHLYNTSVIRFWNRDAHQLWEGKGPNLLRALEVFQGAQSDAAKKAARDLYIARRDNYKGKLEQRFVPVKKKMEKLNDQKKEISDLLKKQPKLVAKGAKLAHGLRLSVSYQWEIDFNKHLRELDNLKDLKDLLKRKRITPPFATEKGFRAPID